MLININLELYVITWIRYYNEHVFPKYNYRNEIIWLKICVFPRYNIICLKWGIFINVILMKVIINLLLRVQRGLSNFAVDNAMYI